MFKINLPSNLLTLALIAFVSVFQAINVSAEDIPKVKKMTLGDAKVYTPGGHFKMEAMRLHNADQGTTQNFGMSFSIFHPGGGADQGSRPIEMVYYVVKGELTITTPDGDIILKENESIYRPVGSIAGIINNSDSDVEMLVVFPVNK